jgi:hypothetical protein
MSRSKKIIILSIICAIVISFGCASIVSKSTYPVSFSSNPDQANIKIVDKKGNAVYEGVTPTVVTLKAGAGFFTGQNYTVICTKPGCEPHEVKIKRDIDGWYVLGNIVFGGLIGWLIVDPATGAMWTLPKEVNIELAKQTTSLSEGGSLINIVLLDDIPADSHFKLIRIK